MSLEDKIHENTLALQQLTEAVNRLAVAAGSSTPVPVAKKAEPAPTPAPAPASAPTQPVDVKALQDSLKDKLKKLFAKSPSTGGKILAKFGVQNLSALPDERLAEFAASVDAALQGN
ncbi:hypothetical protein [Turicimonas muris]|uniref:hypothetical protein n=1 Tax=Turicimonas muris TaxID=1796652 RepID=UPI00248D2D43|nr:hypothetical protein [Turicimonas muris]